MDLTDKDFHHPYTPYEIQNEFMKALYTCIEERKVGIFESPTATDEPEWILEHSRREKIRAAREKRKELENRLARIRERGERQRKRANAEANRPLKKQRRDKDNLDDGSGEDDEQFALDDYDSDAEDSGTRAPKDNNILSTSTLALLEKLKGPSGQHDDSDEEDGVRVFYCSRTHSQLSQFTHELRRVNLPAGIPPETGEDSIKDMSNESMDLEEAMKHVSLGSRKTLCINPKVNSLSNPTAINERCLDLQRPETASDHKCPFIPSKENETLVTEFRDNVLAKVRDIEDMGKIGSELGICPYYASRPVIKQSEIVTLPYPLLLQKSTREALNISLKDHVVIIDEAHNLMDVIANINSVSVSLIQLREALDQLTIYAKKYRNRLKGKNRFYVAQIIRLVGSISNYLESIKKEKGPSDGILEPSNVMAGKGVDQINPHKLSRYLNESKLARKVDGYVEHTHSLQNKAELRSRRAVPVLFQVQSFLLSLMNPAAEGRLFFERSGNDVLLKYMLLDPTNHFRGIVEEARAVILAGGTMSPMNDYSDHLFSYLEPEQLRTFSYGHVIPRENLTAMPVARGIFGTELDFTYEKRGSKEIMTDLGRTIAKMCNVIPDGVVAFFPSYDFLNQVLQHWSHSSPDAHGTILDGIRLNKEVCWESQDKEKNTEEVLQQYSNSIDKGKGALLLSVMGGKLSEGINFSDKLGRAVIIIGLPFPNIKSAVWQAKMQHVEQRVYEQSSGPEEARKAKGKASSREFYENSCMRTVNQCIGRAIRHQNDYAAILLLDRRYGTPRIQSKLPTWIRRSLVSTAQQSAAIGIDSLSSFFHRKQII